MAERFTKKPVTIEAVRFEDNAESLTELSEFTGKTLRVNYTTEVPFLVVETLEGYMKASVGDWVIRGVKDEFYPCKPDIFAETYEPEP